MSKIILDSRDIIIVLVVFEFNKYINNAEPIVRLKPDFPLDLCLITFWRCLLMCELSLMTFEIVIKQNLQGQYQPAAMRRDQDLSKGNFSHV